MGSISISNLLPARNNYTDPGTAVLFDRLGDRRQMNNEIITKNAYCGICLAGCGVEVDIRGW